MVQHLFQIVCLMPIVKFSKVFSQMLFAQRWLEQIAVVVLDIFSSIQFPLKKCVVFKRFVLEILCNVSREK